ncbi:MAG: hypothetical protein LIO86_15030, partial [Lachnospiraceae bacterium]|nr:hypothetical protein [Lachnospiraceae bacterium]
MKYGSCLKKLKRILAVALALALLFNGWSNYDLSVKAEANEEEAVESTSEEEQTAEEEVTTGTEESTETQETQPVEETTGTEETSETTEETAEETESLTIVESFSLGVTKLLGSIPLLTAAKESVTVSIADDAQNTSSTIIYSAASQGTVQLTATATTVVDSTNVSNDVTWTWSSSDSSVANVDPSNGLVTAGSTAGTATISVTFESDDYETSDEPKYSVTVNIETVANEITSVSLGGTELNDSSNTMTYGDSNNLTIATTYSTPSAGSFTVETFSDATCYTSSETVIKATADAGIYTLETTGAGSAYLKVTYTPDSTYYTGGTTVEAVYPITEEPKTVYVYADSDAELTKESDGTTALTDINKTAISADPSTSGYFTLTDATGSKVDSSSVVLAWKTGLALDDGKYNTSGLDASSVTGLDSLSGYLTLTDTTNYTLDTTNLASGSWKGSITPQEVDDNEYSVEKSAGCEIKINGTIVATVSSGVPDSNNEYYYGTDGTTKPCVITAESGYSIVDEDGDSLNLSNVLTTSQELYIAKDADIDYDVIYYGPIVVKDITFDTELPTITLSDVSVASGSGSPSQSGTGYVYNDGAVKFTVTISDNYSGVESPIYYYISESGEVADISSIQWNSKDLADESGTLTATFSVGEKGYLYVKAVDKVGNSSEVNEYTLLVLEDEKPTVEASCTDATSPSTSKKIEITAKDSPDDKFSGIQQIEWALYKSGDTASKDKAGAAAEGTIQNGNVPTTLDAIKQEFTPDLLEIKASDYSESLNGEYVLYIWAIDWCGNEGEWTTVTLDFDTEEPVLTVDFGNCSGSDDDKDYYNETFTVTFTVTDNYPLTAVSLFTLSVSGGDGSVEFDTDNAQTSGDKTNGYSYVVEATVTADSTSHTTDGEYTFTISGADQAGNVLKSNDDVNIEDKEMEAGSTGSFSNARAKVMDTTAPILDSVEYDDSSFYYKGGGYYFGDAATKTITLTLTEKNFSEDAATESISLTCDGASAEPEDISWEDGSSDDSHVATVTLPETEGTYVLTFNYQDLATNAMVSGNTELTVNNGSFTSENMIVDLTAPTATITYSSDATAYVYGKDDDNAKATGAVYYNQNVKVNIAITDNNKLDSEKLTNTVVDLSGSGTELSDSITISTDGTYSYSAYGTDRAGNPLTVIEEISGTKSNQGAAGDPITTEECEDAYTSRYAIVLDTVQPTFVLEIDRSGATNKSLQAGRYYFNSDYTATVTVTEANFDSERITVNCASGTATGTSAVTLNNYVASYDWSGSNPYTWTETVSAEGVYRYQMSGVDKAGNALTYSDTTELQDTANLLSYYIEVDKTDPTGTLTVNDYYEIDIASGSLSKSEPYRDETSATVNITTADLSPVLIGYTIDSTVDGTSAKSAGYGYQQTASTPVSGEQVFTVTGIKVTDRAGNY